MSQIQNNSDLADEEISVILFLEIEDLPYIEQLTADDIAFININYCLEENDEIKISGDVNILYNFDYDEFSLMRAVEESEHG
jgi:hypothetical protein